MMHNKRMLGYYNYTVILTYAGMLTGMLGIVSAFDGNTVNAVMCLMLAGICDMFDGAIAATDKKRTENERSFGIQIDSMSDLICFGMLPFAIAYSMSAQNQAILVIGCGYVLCALIRLAYFNVDEQERQKRILDHRKTYYGLPVTFSAMVIPAVYVVCNVMRKNSCVLIAGILVVMSGMFLMPFELKKPKILGRTCILLFGAVEMIIVALSHLYV